MGALHLHTGEDPSALFMRAAAIIKIVEVCDSDAKAVAALEALTKLTNSTSSMNISNCSFNLSDKGDK